MNTKLLAVVSALSVIGMFMTFAFGGATISGYYGEMGTENASSLNLSGITDTISELFQEIIPLIAYMAIFGGLIAGLPRLFKFKF